MTKIKESNLGAQILGAQQAGLKVVERVCSQRAKVAVAAFAQKALSAAKHGENVFSGLSKDDLRNFHFNNVTPRDTAHACVFSAQEMTDWEGPNRDVVTRPEFEAAMKRAIVAELGKHKIKVLDWGNDGHGFYGAAVVSPTINAKTATKGRDPYA